jgi:hypothetical protein
VVEQGESLGLQGSVAAGGKMLQVCTHVPFSCSHWQQDRSQPFVVRFATFTVTCLVATAYANGAIDDRADKGNLMFQSELISFIFDLVAGAQAFRAQPRLRLVSAADVCAGDWGWRLHFIGSAMRHTRVALVERARVELVGDRFTLQVARAA